MKKILFLLMPMMLLVSCEKQYLIPSDEVPYWLKQRIAETEKQLRSDSHSGYEMTAWSRYSYEGSYYYEWYNVVSSAFPPVYNTKGDLMTFSSDVYMQYQAEKCCRVIVWKSPDYPDDL